MSSTTYLIPSNDIRRDLPNELWDLICSHLRRSRLSVSRSLGSFALTSRRFNAIARRHLFSQLSFRWGEIELLPEVCYPYLVDLRLLQGSHQEFWNTPRFTSLVALQTVEICCSVIAPTLWNSLFQEGRGLKLKSLSLKFCTFDCETNEYYIPQRHLDNIEELLVWSSARCWCGQHTHGVSVLRHLFLLPSINKLNFSMNQTESFLMHHYLVVIMPQLKVLARAFDGDGKPLDLGDYLAHSTQLEHLVINSDDMVTHLNTSTLSLLTTLESPLQLVPIFVSQCKSLRRLDILWTAQSASHIPKAFQAIAKSSITTLTIINFTSKQHSGVALQSLSREGVIQLEHILNVDAILFSPSSNLFQELGPFPNLKTVQLNLTLYDGSLFPSTQDYFVLLASEDFACLLGANCPKLEWFRLSNGYRYVEGIRSTSGRWACELYWEE